MAQRKAHEVESWLSRPDPGYRIILVYGPDRGLVSERARRCCMATGVPLDDPFAVVRLDAAELDSQGTRLREEAFTIPLFGGERLIWVRNAGAAKGLADAVRDLVKAPPEMCSVVIEAGDLKRGSPLRAAVEGGERAMALPCYPDEGRSIDQIVEATLAANEKTMTNEAKAAFRQLAGGDRLATRGELEKLMLYCAGVPTITLDDVLASVGDVASASVDGAVDAAISGRAAGIEHEMARIDAGGTPEFLVLLAAARQLQTLHSVRLSVEREGMAVSAGLAAIRPPLFGTRKAAIEAALNRWSVASIEHALDRVHNTILATRQRPALAGPLVRQTLYGLAAATARGGR